MRLKMPVETNSGCSSGSKSLGASPSAEASCFLLIFAGLKIASFWVMVTRCGRPSLKRISTGKTPAPVSWRMWTPPSCAGTTPNSASKNHVPITGCPASLSSSFVVKMRKRARASSSVGFCTKTVSERFISRAMASIWSSESPSPSVNTASGLPSKRLLVKTSSV